MCGPVWSLAATGMRSGACCATRCARHKPRRWLALANMADTLRSYELHQAPAAVATPVARPAPVRRLPRVWYLLGRATRSSVAIAALLAAWETLPRVGAVDPVFLPPFSQVLRAWYDLLLSGELL